MTRLTVYNQSSTERPVFASTDFAAIQAELKSAGITLKRWKASQPVDATSSSDEVLEAYDAEIQRLVAEGGYQTWDVISMTPDHPQKAEFRQKFLSEHTHGEDEVRFFVDGEGLFSLHLQEKVFAVLCQKGDLISVPAGTRHWFDMGPNPKFTAIRLFNNPEGWVAQFTGDDIADRFPRLDQ